MADGVSGDSGRSFLRLPNVFVATAIERGWFCERLVVRDLIHLIAGYICRFGTTRLGFAFSSRVCCV